MTNWDELEGPHAGLLADHVPERPSRALRISAGERHISRGGGGGLGHAGASPPVGRTGTFRHFFDQMVSNWCLSNV